MIYYIITLYYILMRALVLRKQLTPKRGLSIKQKNYVMLHKHHCQKHLDNKTHSHRNTFRLNLEARPEGTRQQNTRHGSCVLFLIRRYSNGINLWRWLVTAESSKNGLTTRPLIIIRVKCVPLTNVSQTGCMCIRNRVSQEGRMTVGIERNNARAQRLCHRSRTNTYKSAV